MRPKTGETGVNEKRGIIIHFMDGSNKYLEFPKQLADEYSQSLRLKELLAARHLVVEAEGALLVFPFDNIKYLQAYPAPKRLPEYTIKGAAFKD
jgi:hypothetical protein